MPGSEPMAECLQSDLLLRRRLPQLLAAADEQVAAPVDEMTPPVDAVTPTVAGVRVAAPAAETASSAASVTQAVAGERVAVPEVTSDAQDAPEVTPMEDEEVPLGVLDDGEENPGGEIIEIQDEEVPLASMPAASGRIWWSWIPVIGAIASAVEGYRRNKQDEEASADDKKEE